MRLVVTAQKKWEALTLSFSFSFSLDSLRVFFGCFFKRSYPKRFYPKRWGIINWQRLIAAAGSIPDGLEAIL